MTLEPPIGTMKSKIRRDRKKNCCDVEPEITLMSKGVFSHFHFSPPTPPHQPLGTPYPVQFQPPPIVRPSCTVPLPFRFDFHSIALALYYWTRVWKKLDCLLSTPRVDDQSDTEFSARFSNIVMFYGQAQKHTCI